MQLPRLQSAFHLVELMIALAILAIASAVAVPAWTEYVDKADIADTKSAISSISQAIERFYIRNEHYPDSLADIGVHALLDPWGNPYQYLRINGAGLKGKGAVRKDKNLNPVNSDFDLYSMGKDEDTKKPFTAKASWDDVVRANNGRFIGLAKDY